MNRPRWINTASFWQELFAAQDRAWKALPADVRERRVVKMKLSVSLARYFDELDWPGCN